MEQRKYHLMTRLEVSSDQETAVIEDADVVGNAFDFANLVRRGKNTYAISCDWCEVWAATRTARIGCATEEPRSRRIGQVMRRNRQTVEG